MKKILWYTAIITATVLLVAFFSSCSTYKASIGKKNNDYRYHNYKGEFGGGKGNRVY